MIAAPPVKWPELIACGILKREIAYLARKNQWPVAIRFLDSSLHVDFDRLAKALTQSLSKHPNRQKLVVYGTCHPRMDDLLCQADAHKIPGQNCIEIILGRAHFSSELSNGAFFLFEDWARRWEQVSLSYFKDEEMMRQIYQEAHSYLLCIRTPCSQDFEPHAQKVSAYLGLPLIWEDVSLDHLEQTLTTTIDAMIRKQTDG